MVCLVIGPDQVIVALLRTSDLTPEVKDTLRRVKCGVITQ